MISIRFVSIEQGQQVTTIVNSLNPNDVSNPLSDLYHNYQSSKSGPIANPALSLIYFVEKGMPW